MTSTLTALLRQARADRAVLGVSLVTGHYREIQVRAVGDVWFSARSTGMVSSEIVVSHNAVRTLTGLSEQEEPGEESSGHSPRSRAKKRFSCARTSGSQWSSVWRYGTAGGSVTGDATGNPARFGSNHHYRSQAGVCGERTQARVSRCQLSHERSRSHFCYHSSFGPGNNAVCQGIKPDCP